jgi:hypothetical protein
MKIAWVFSENIDLALTVSISELRRSVPAWGSWKTWRGYGTDNVVCTDNSKAQELCEQNFPTMCNFYAHTDNWKNQTPPPGVNTFSGDFSHNLVHHDDIVALHLAGSLNDIVLLLGFDFSTATTQEKTNYLGLASAAFKQYKKTQWVIVDHRNTLNPMFDNINNITQDKLDNVLGMINQ